MTVNAVNMNKWQVTAPDGTVIVCNSAEDLTVALVAIRRSTDAMSIDAPRRRASKKSARTPNMSPGSQWTVPLVKQVFEKTTTKAGEMIAAALELGEGGLCSTLAEKLKTRAGGFGPMIAKFNRDAKEIAPYLGEPVSTSGKPGHKTMHFEPSFLAACEEVIKER